MSATVTTRPLFEAALVRAAMFDAVRKLHPRHMIRNPVLFVVEVCSAFTSVLAIHAAVTGHGDAPASFTAAVSIWLWFTLLFATFAEAMAEGRGKAQADTLRKARADVTAQRLPTDQGTLAAVLNNLKQVNDPTVLLRHCDPVPSAQLRLGHVILVRAGELIAADGEAIGGVASVDESAITGESAPVIRESGGDRSAVTGGTRVLSDWLVIRVTANPGEAFLDRMIALVEGAKRGKTPNEIALDILLAGLSLVLLLATVTLLPFSIYAVGSAGQGSPVSMTVLVALLVCLIPTTIGGLLSAIGIAGMDRLISANVIATSGRAVEAAGDVDILLLDKTGTITLGNRQASAFLPTPGVSATELATAARMSSLGDETPEGRSIVTLADKVSPGEDVQRLVGTARLVPFTAQTRMSGVDLPQPDGSVRAIRKGAADTMALFVAPGGGALAVEVMAMVHEVARGGGTPLVVAEGKRVLGVIHLKDIVKTGIRDKFAELRAGGIRTIMITGDNPLTAAAIAAEAGVDDFLAEATPEAKLAMIRKYQSEGHLVAMTGDGTNDAPALAQADVAVAMNSGTQAAKEAGNMVDLDSNPTKLLQIVHIGKQMLMTRGALTTFSLANDIAKYFAIIPAAFVATYPALGQLNVMQLHSPNTAILSAVIFNALILIALIPLALRGIAYKPAPASVLLRRNLLVYGVGGALLPFPCIKGIDLILTALGVA